MSRAERRRNDHLTSKGKLTPEETDRLENKRRQWEKSPHKELREAFLAALAIVRRSNVLPYLERRLRNHPGVKSRLTLEMMLVLFIFELVRERQLPARRHPQGDADPGPAERLRPRPLHKGRVEPDNPQRHPETVFELGARPGEGVGAGHGLERLKGRDTVQPRMVHGQARPRQRPPPGPPKNSVRGLGRHAFPNVRAGTQLHPAEVGQATRPKGIQRLSCRIRLQDPDTTRPGRDIPRLPPHRLHRAAA